MNHEELMKNINSAKKQVAETCISNPGIYGEYGSWMHAKRDVEEAKKRLEIAEKKWSRMIAPALEDPLYKRIAEKKDLIPKPRQEVDLNLISKSVQKRLATQWGFVKPNKDQS